VCISAIALYCLCVSVTKSECVTQLLINPIIRNRTRLISGVCHPTLDNIFYFLIGFVVCSFARETQHYQRTAKEVCFSLVL
jgi:hypothetical protein